LITLKIQVGERQVSEYPEEGMPFGLGDGAGSEHQTHTIFSLILATIKRFVSFR
jgi:hypothetical protein